MATTAVTVTVRKGDGWAPVESLTAEQQAEVRRRVTGVLQDTLRRQVAMLQDAEREQRRAG